MINSPPCRIFSCEGGCFCVFWYFRRRGPSGALFGRGVRLPSPMQRAYRAGRGLSALTVHRTPGRDTTKLCSTSSYGWGSWALRIPCHHSLQLLSRLSCLKQTISYSMRLQHVERPLVGSRYADADMESLSLDSTCIKVHESSNGGGKTADKAVGRTRGGLNTKLHAIVDGLGNPVKFMLSAGNDHDSVHAVELLEKVEISGSNVLADRAYGAKAIRAYISEQWFRRIATRYDKLDASFLAFVYLDSIAILLI